MGEAFDTTDAQGGLTRRHDRDARHDVDRGNEIPNMFDRYQWVRPFRRRVAPRPRTAADQNRHALHREPSVH
eukprot:6901270-Prymnesium_polylepis.1